MLYRFFFTLVIVAAISGRVHAQSGDIHADWDALLKKHVSATGVVNYRGFITDSLVLNRYLTHLSTNPPQAKNRHRNEQLAWWLNAYNAYTVRLIIRHYPLKSINDIKKAGVHSPWDIPFIALDGASLTLNHIEHEILRKQFGDPRIHFAIVCASQSCPKLAAEAFTAGELNEQLERLTRAFLNDPSRNVITARQARVSQIFNWFKEDFTSQGTLTEFINRYSRTRIDPETPVTYLEYDWALNDR
jgi:hypothetical protein